MIIVAISGASGPIMGIRLIEELLNLEEEVAAIVSKTGRKIIEHEVLNNSAYTSLKDLLEKRGVTRKIGLLKEYENSDFFSPSASGSSEFEAVVVVPCSMKTLSAIASGYADNLIVRTCDVAFKEKRRCIIVPRETPLNLIHVENMRKAMVAGAEMVPPVPGFYTHPETIDDVVDFIVGKLLNLLGRKQSLLNSWGSSE
ncbi:MAG: UbiX family flavin prenyltransferase [Desulfobacterales bacterium]|jgi:flavin prenyltransferase|nr:UbiX family flavin prenyltransferase [Desulfobacteraceae bacterium]MBT4365143.1 UbiX family flavin prenyltransferase [Desulfobacteraceae bacterium]MBT7084579.1 UbiX family flavin prenyltransferase [Desulfobacterales bacterium]MBT7696978.1 UbiX family flavin prenyltransferase [Desulfobacterales bacterium]